MDPDSEHPPRRTCARPPLPGFLRQPSNCASSPRSRPLVCSPTAASSDPPLPAPPRASHLTVLATASRTPWDLTLVAPLPPAPAPPSPTPAPGPGAPPGLCTWGPSAWMQPAVCRGLRQMALRQKALPSLPFKHQPGLARPTLLPLQLRRHRSCHVFICSWVVVVGLWLRRGRSGLRSPRCVGICWRVKNGRLPRPGGAAQFGLMHTLGLCLLLSLFLLYWGETSVTYDVPFFRAHSSVGLRPFTLLGDHHHPPSLSSSQTETAHPLNTNSP